MPYRHRRSGSDPTLTHIPPHDRNSKSESFNRAPRKIQIFVGVATRFQGFQALQVRNMAINRGAQSADVVPCNLGSAAA